MTRRDWWLGVTLVVLALLAHALVPRYEWSAPSGGSILRIDRWLGQTEVMKYYEGRFRTAAEIAATKK